MKLSLKSLTAVTLIALSTITAQAITSQDIQKLYTATFDRVPDRAGVDYWLNSGLAIEEVAQSFFDQKEMQTKYPDGLPQEEFVKSVYQNLFNREPDSDGLNYWIKELNSENITLGNFILAVINGAKGDDITILNKKSQVSENFLNGEITEEEAKVALKAIGDESKDREALEVFIENSDILITPVDKARVRDKFNSGGLDLAKKEEAKIRDEKRIKEDLPKLEEELDATNYLTDEDKKSITKVLREKDINYAIQMLNELEEQRKSEVVVDVPPSEPSTSTTTSTLNTGGDTGGSGNGGGGGF